MELSFGAGPRAGENSSGTVPEGSDPSLAELFRGLSSIFVQGELDQSRFRLEAPSQDVGQNRCGFRVVPLLPQLARILISIEVHADMKSGRPAAAILREVGGDETRIELSDLVVGEHR